MAVYYIENDNGSFASADGTRRFIKLSGKEALDYLRTEEGSKKRFMRTSRHEDGGEDEFVEVTPGYLKQHRREERREQYISDCMEASEFITISLYAMQDNDSDDLISGEELIADPTVDIEEQALRAIDLGMLRQSLASLTEKEMWLIHRLFLSETPVTELQLSRETGIPQKTLNDRKMRVLKKLEKYISKMTR